MKVDRYGELSVAFLTTGPIQENAVLVWGARQLGFLIDPGDEPGRILAWIQALGVTVQAILLTHAHFDHIGAVQPLREALGAAVYAHPDGAELYRLGAQSAARWNLPFVQPEPAEHELSAGQVLQAGDLTLTVQDLPGHAPGHVVLVGEGFAVVGDTLFAGSVGRTDLPGGDHALLLRGIRRELLGLPDHTALYPGHGDPTTVGRERAGNPFLQ